MTDHDAIDMMRRCRDEILGLRARLTVCEPKAEAYDAIASILGLLPKRSQAFGEDIAYRLEKQIAEEEMRLKACHKEAETDQKFARQMAEIHRRDSGKDSGI